MKIKPFTRAWYVRNWIVFLTFHLPLLFVLTFSALMGVAFVAHFLAGH